jgi:peptide deformylase
MNHISDWLTHIDNKEDQPYLRSKLLDVNMRLLRANGDYRELVLMACNHLKNHCLMQLEGYKLPHGTSGANLGIPWNIIAIARNRGRHDAWAEIMINPMICKYCGTQEEASSNCGSIRLENPIKVLRYPAVIVSWFDIGGVARKELFTREQGSFTLQHEIDHNNGILITDRAGHH